MSSRASIAFSVLREEIEEIVSQTIGEHLLVGALLSEVVDCIENRRDLSPPRLLSPLLLAQLAQGQFRRVVSLIENIGFVPLRSSCDSHVLNCAVRHTMTSRTLTTSRRASYSWTEFVLESSKLPVLYGFVFVQGCAARSPGEIRKGISKNNNLFTTYAISL